VRLSPTKNRTVPDCNWDDAFRGQLRELFQLRRDVRRFRSDPLGATAMRRLLESACMAPSVGLSQPWRFVSVTSPKCRAEVVAEFEAENELAAARFDAATHAEYRMLKLAGLREAPEQLAVFIQNDPPTGRGLGRATMPESVAYSVVAAIQNLWLAARADGIGVGWVSILRPEAVAAILNVSNEWQLIAYLCIGYPMDDHCDRPELERLGWENRSSLDENWIER
jgi:5,6-dimethylbenzimidazole synthase